MFQITTYSQFSAAYVLAQDLISYIFLTASTCIGSGFNAGHCCNSDVFICLAADETCSCDAACYVRGDCCKDIEKLGCFK